MHTPLRPSCGRLALLVLSLASIAGVAGLGTMYAAEPSVDQSLRWSAPVGEASDASVIDAPRGTGTGGRLSRPEALRLAAPVTDGSAAVADQPARSRVGRLSRSQALQHAAPVGD
ncbi:MAG: hypothetical protein LIP77_06050 [Planctomycetes bacterium]|nr:hypothetical protein [Planctomycetota bacterium]